MKVLVVSTSFPSSAHDSTSLFLLHRARDLQRLGVDIRVLAPAGPGKPPGETEVRGIGLKRFYFPGWKTSRLVYGAGMAENLKRMDTRRGFFGFVSSMLRAVRRETESTDIIDAQWLGTGAAVITAAAGGWGRGARTNRRRVPIVTTAHRFSEGKAWFFPNRFVLARADCTVFCSRFLLDRALSRFRVRRAEVVYPAFMAAPADDDEEISMPPGVTRDVPVILALGRMVEKKGFIHLVEAAARVLSKTRCFFLLGGDGPEKKKIVSLVSELGIGDRFKLLGRIPPRRVRSLYAAADIFVMPSVADPSGEIETFGAVLAEAMAADLPVIGFSSGSIPELIENGVNGRLVREKDEAGLAEAISGLLDNPELRKRYGSNSQRKAMTVLNPELQAKKLVGIYKSLQGQSVKKGRQ